ncbi:hypothetical protein, partial [Mycobacterium helveticum]|uniref:hypothetical protein n=1 Tax=Mycobacterium helveticum TaxID=2592811 RepID=UPI001AEF61A6
MRLSALGGLGSAPFGDRSARSAKLLTNDFRVVVSIRVNRCGGMRSPMSSRLVLGEDSLECAVFVGGV